MQVSVEKLPESRVQFRVEVPPDEVRPFLESAAKELSKEHPAKGFRPGAVPLEVMRGVVGDERIAERALKALVPKTYVEALLEREDIEAIGPPEVAAERIAFGETWVYRATVAVLPTVTLGDYRGLTVPRRTVRVEAAEVERELETLRKMRASYLTVPRPAQQGDRVEVDIVGTLDRVPLESGNQRRQPLLLGEHRLVPGFEENLVGMKEGETKTFSVRFPENHHAGLQGKTVEFTVTMGTVQQQVLPARDDAFAHGLGNFRDLADLQEKLNANIREEKERRERERFQQALLERVIAGATFGTFPEALVSRELDLMLSELKEGTAGMGLTFDAYLAQIKKTREDVRTGMRDQALRRIRAGLVLRVLAKVEGISSTEEEVESEVNEALKQFQGTAEEAAGQLDMDGLRALAAGTVRNRKVFEFLEAMARNSGT